MVYKVVDFFCGAGGFSEGFHQAGFEVIKAFDIWEPAIKTHNKNHPNITPIATQGDVQKISNLSDEEFEKIVPDSEVIIGSPPCVAFSNSNKSGKADKTLGISLLKSYLRIIARKMFKKDSILKYWILENVTNIEQYIQIEYTMEELNLPGNDVLRVKKESSGVYKMQYYGVPTTRRRYICGKFPAPDPILNDKNTISLENVIDSLGAPFEKESEIIRDLNFNIEMPGSLVTDHHYIKEIADFEWRKAKRQKQDKGYMGRMSFPENMKRPARTIMATMSGASRESFILPFGNNKYRFPTIREVATVMSFPIDYRFYGDSDSIKYKLVGNAVPPKFSYALAKKIKEEENINERIVVKKKKFNILDEFTNLNGKQYEPKIEKLKNKKAKYKYHVPYMKIDTFRTELLNYFEDEKVKWDVEIHKGQGKSAKSYKGLRIDLSFIEYKEKEKLDLFIESVVKEIQSFEKFQENYRLPTIRREEENLIGPDELLAKVKEVIINDFSTYDKSILIRNMGIDIPQKIIVAYYILNGIIEKLSNNS